MPDERLEQLVSEVCAGRKYAAIAPELVRRLSGAALQKGLTGKAAVKDVRNKLHQVGGAYFKHPPDYAGASTALSALPADLSSEEVRPFCREQMRAHASTAERLSVLETFFQICLAPIAPVRSVLDLACGFNPLAIPWMPLQGGFHYTACDIYQDMLDFLQAFFDHYGINGQAASCDLVGGVPQKEAQVAFLLKTIPCLEQVDKSVGLPLLEAVRAEHILVSFPVASLGGRKKGMPAFYREHFLDMLKAQSWSVREFSFETELAFLVSK